MTRESFFKSSKFLRFWANDHLARDTVSDRYFRLLERKHSNLSRAIAFQKFVAFFKLDEIWNPTVNYWTYPLDIDVWNGTDMKCFRSWIGYVVWRCHSVSLNYWTPWPRCWTENVLYCRAMRIRTPLCNCRTPLHFSNRPARASTAATFSRFAPTSPPTTEP